MLPNPSMAVKGRFKKGCLDKPFKLRYIRVMTYPEKCIPQGVNCTNCLTALHSRSISPNDTVIIEKGYDKDHDGSNRYLARTTETVKVRPDTTLWGLYHADVLIQYTDPRLLKKLPPDAATETFFMAEGLHPDRWRGIRRLAEKLSGGPSTRLQARPTR